MAKQQWLGSDAGLHSASSPASLNQEGETMIRVLLALVLLVGSFASPCLGEMKADAAYGVRYAKEQVFDLPQDQNKPYLTVFGVEGDSRYKAVKEWFNTNETLIAIKDQT